MTEFWIWFFWTHLNESISPINSYPLRIPYNGPIGPFWLINSIPWIQNIEFSSIFSQEFILWIHVYEIRFMNSDLIVYWYYEFLYVNLFTYVFKETFEFIYMNSYTHEFMYSFHIWVHLDYEFIWSFHIWIRICMNSYEFIHMNSCKIWNPMNSHFSWIHTSIQGYQVSKCCRRQLKNRLPLGYSDAWEDDWSLGREGRTACQKSCAWISRRRAPVSALSNLYN